jgi:hypothetical protein
MDTGKTLDNNGTSAEVTRLQRSMLTAASLTIVVFSDNAPADTVSLIIYTTM